MPHRPTRPLRWCRGRFVGLRISYRGTSTWEPQSDAGYISVRYVGPMTGLGDRSRWNTPRWCTNDRLNRWLSSPSVIFPAAAMAMAPLTFTKSPVDGLMVVALLVALVPWVFVALGLRMHPLAVMVSSLVPVTWLVVSRNGQGALFIMLAGVMWAAAEDHRTVAVVGVIGGSAAALACSVASPEFDMGMVWLLWAAGLVFAWFAGELLRRQVVLAAQLASVRHELDAAALAAERKTIARDVHDIVGHSLTVVLLNIAGARRHLATNPDAAADALERAESISRESLENIRSVVGLLSTDAPSNGNAPLPSGRDAIPLLEQARQSGIAIDWVVMGDPTELEPAIGLTVVRLLQEALSNAARHAPGQSVEVELTINDHSVDAEIRNRTAVLPMGATANDAAATRRSGMGLANMAERVHAVHGTLSASSFNGRWVVRANLPRQLLARSPQPASDVPAAQPSFASPLDVSMA
jgi:signal transduction histidine kinase